MKPKIFVYIYGDLESEYFTLETAELFAPCRTVGTCFAEPLFGGEINVLQTRRIVTNI